MKNDELALVKQKDLSLVENNLLNGGQLQHILKHTPEKYVKERPAKGGGRWKYVTGGYVKKCLNLMFGWDWDFEIVNHAVVGKEIVVQGKLTCRSGDRAIIKTQFGCKDIMFKKGTEEYLSIGNDMKAAATDALKKCAAEIGIAADIYNAEEFREIVVEQEPEISIDDLKELYELKKDSITEEQRNDATRIINNKETKSYTKLHNLLKGA